MYVSIRYKPPCGTCENVTRHSFSPKSPHTVHGTTSSPVLSSAMRALTIAETLSMRVKESGSSCERRTGKYRPRTEISAVPSARRLKTCQLDAPLVIVTPNSIVSSRLLSPHRPVSVPYMVSFCILHIPLSRCHGADIGQGGRRMDTGNPEKAAFLFLRGAARTQAQRGLAP